jgi:hypothetical protein
MELIDKNTGQKRFRMAGELLPTGALFDSIPHMLYRICAEDAVLRKR